MRKCKDPHNPYESGPPEHAFGEWQPHSESGFIIFTHGKRTGHLEPFAREWQERTCKDCGLLERSDLPTPVYGPSPLLSLGIIR